jgi:hypothetical protein
MIEEKGNTLLYHPCKLSFFVESNQVPKTYPEKQE